MYANTVKGDGSWTLLLPDKQLRGSGPWTPIWFMVPCVMGTCVNAEVGGDQSAGTTRPLST